MSGTESQTPAPQNTSAPRRIRIGPPMVNKHVEGRAEVKLIKEGDAIKSIQVICRCGEIINIQCVYSEQS